MSATMNEAWAKVETEAARLRGATLLDLFAADPKRVEALTFEAPHLKADFSKQRIDGPACDAVAALARAADFDGWRAKLFNGEAVNTTENRAARHWALRITDPPGGDDEVTAVLDRMHEFAHEIGESGDFDAVIHIGIGGSDLGPRLVLDALKAYRRSNMTVRFAANVDGADVADAIEGLDPKRTLLIVVSKTFTTQETLLNASSALEWMTEGGVEDPYGRVIALTAMPDRAIAWGVDETRILPFPETVGGRYSLWSSIGFPAALALGWEAFEELLEGAAEMDRHFRLTPWAENIPVLAAFADLYYSQIRGCKTRAQFAYDERLRLLPSYLQQLEMESNGKGVRSDGAALGRHSAPITWGGVGTDAQHAVFQLLHQGTHLVPVEFVASIEPGHDFSEEHHAVLLGNCFAQGAALMKGRVNAEDPARAYPGDRPSSTILLDRIEPRTLGALIAFFEHRTFANAVILGINPFDQFGVELGKEMAKAIDAGDDGAIDSSTAALMAAAFGTVDQTD